MKWHQNISIAAPALRMNLLRTSLTVIIIGLGIMALVSMLTSADGMKGALRSSFASLGSDVILLENSSQMGNFNQQGVVQKKDPEISYAEAKLFKSQYPDPKSVTLHYQASFMTVVRYADQKTPPRISVIGTDENYLAINKIALQQGRSFTADEVRRGQGSAIIGAGLASDLFGNEQPTGKTIFANNQPFTVVGVMEKMGNVMGESKDNLLIVPLEAAQKSFGTGSNNYKIYLRPARPEYVDEMVNEARGIFRPLRGLRLGDKDNFALTRSDSLASGMESGLGSITAIAFIIGLITLGGAAVGLTNIMLVSVSERTREIGIRKSMGATKVDIRNQFLWESIIIGQLGGVLGIAAGLVVGNAVSGYFSQPFSIPWNWIVMAVVTCSIVSILAGLFPALKAAKLDPIDSLRYE